MTIADRIKQKRIEKDWSQTDLALKAGYNNKTAICKLEHAGDDISMKQVKRIAQALNVSPAYLMGWEVQKINTVLPVFSEGDDLDRMVELYTAYTKAIPEIQAAVESLLKPQLPDS